MKKSFLLLLPFVIFPLLFNSVTLAQENQPITYEQESPDKETTPEENKSVVTNLIQMEREYSPTYSFTTILLAILFPCLFLLLGYLILKLVKF
jgi:hypothetical protein